MKKAKPTSQNPFRFTLILGAGIAVVVTPLALLLGNSLEGAAATFAVCLLLPSAILITIWGLVILPLAGAHELGHFLAGRREKLTLYSLKVWPVRVVLLPDRKWIFDWTETYLGAVAMWSTDGRVDVAKYRRFVWGGPIANLIAAAVIVSAAVAMPENDLRPLVFMMGGLSLSMAFGNLLQKKPKTQIFTDGQWLDQIRDEPETAAGHVALGQLAHLLTHGTRLDDLPPALEQECLRSKRPEHRLATISAYATAAISEGAFFAAAPYLERHLAIAEDSHDADAVKAFSAMIVGLYGNAGPLGRNLMPVCPPSRGVAKAIFETADACLTARELGTQAGLSKLSRVEETLKTLEPQSSDFLAASKLFLYAKSQLEFLSKCPEPVRRVQELWLTAVRPKTWDPSLFEAYADYEPGTWGMMACAEVVHRIDVGDPKAIDECSKRVSVAPQLLKAPPGHKTRFWAEVAAYRAFHLQDLPSARFALAEAEKGNGTQRQALLAARAAVLALEGNQPEATRILDELDAVIESRLAWVPRYEEQAEKHRAIRELAASGTNRDAVGLILRGGADPT